MTVDVVLRIAEKMTGVCVGGVFVKISMADTEPGQSTGE
jgi:hypothetical protein